MSKNGVEYFYTEISILDHIYLKNKQRDKDNADNKQKRM